MRRWLRVEMPRAVFALCFDGDVLVRDESANYGLAVLARAGCALDAQSVLRALHERGAKLQWL